jgi:pilus assembly protein Flp/PilA
MFATINTRLKNLIGDKRGVTAVEYTVIAALIIVAIAAAFTTLGGDISTEIGTVSGYV